MLTQHSLFRCIYHVSSEEGKPLPFFGRRKTVVADHAQEAMERVTEHERAECPDVQVDFTEVVRESIEVWS